MTHGRCSEVRPAPQEVPGLRAEMVAMAIAGLVTPDIVLEQMLDRIEGRKP